MEKLSLKIGGWAAWAQTAIGYAYLLAYIALIVVFGIRPWTTIEDFAAQVGTPYYNALTAVQVLAFLQALLVLVIANVVYDYTAPAKKIHGRLGIIFAAAFAILSSMHYYIQWVGVRQSILRNDLTGLGLFVQFNFDSPISAANMLGWMFFYGLTCLVLGFVFNGTLLERWIRWGLIINGVGCVLCAGFLAFGAKWIYLAWTLLISVTWYVYPLMGILFRRIKAQADPVG